MSYQATYKHLLEVFPQVDNRILKAVAFEHGDDLGAAVEFIVCDVLPLQLPADMTSSPDGNVVDLGDSVRGVNGSSIDEHRTNFIDVEDENSDMCNFVDLVSRSSSDDDDSVVGKYHCDNFVDLEDENSVRDDGRGYLVNSLGLITPIVESSQDGHSVVTKIENDCEEIHQEDDTAMVRSTRSIVDVDILEGCVLDATNCKEYVTSAMESIIQLTTLAEALEESAKQATEASPAGQDTVAHVETVKQTLQNAKQAHDMRAGEVYGEKAILLTEAKELQSRLLNLSDERHNFFLIVDEIRETLEARIAAANNEKAAAEKEKLEKERLAQTALKEQEALLEAMAQDSKKLEQEAVENARLRDFLMDKGQVVDALHGELAVMFEDALLLKKQVDEHAPLKGSLLLRTYSSASSSSSRGYKSIHSADGLVHAERSENTREGAEDQQRPVPEEAATIGGNEKSSCPRKEAIIDDDWELLKHDGSPF